MFVCLFPTLLLTDPMLRSRWGHASISHEQVKLLSEIGNDFELANPLSDASDEVLPPRRVHRRNPHLHRRCLPYTSAAISASEHSQAS
jgi:hypothetical protein